MKTNIQLLKELLNEKGKLKSILIIIEACIIIVFLFPIIFLLWILVLGIEKIKDW